MHLTAMHLDRAVGVLLGGAAGDALGAAYEFGGPLTHDHPVDMSGGGQLGWEPGEWTDDTSMAIAIARLLADGRPLTSEATLDSLVEAWKGWSAGAKDVGVQISTVLRSLRVSTAAAARDAARALHELTGRSAGNGSLMRTGPVALAYLDDGQERALADAARAVSALTHWETDAGDACVLWSLAVRHAVRTGELDLTGQLAYLPEERRERWAGLIDEAEKSRPRDFSKNGWTVEALQGAWSAIHHGTGLVDTLERAVRGGHDTDTVAAIAGALAGAVHGGSAVPARWRQVLHGWPGIGVRDLTDLAVLAARGGHPDRTGWPTIDRYPPSPEDVLIPHPLDDGVLLASLAGLDRLPPDVELVVSLCRIGRHQTDRTHVEFWLVDQPGSNLDTQFVLLDAADMIARERAAGRRVAVHCFEARSRTAAAAATYAVRHLGIGLDETWTALHQARPAFDPQPFLVDAVAAIALQLGADRSDPDARPDQGQLAATADQEDQEDQGGSRAAGQDQAPPASRFVIAQSWWIGSEIARRNNLELYEMHPGGGQYDVLAVMARVPEVGAPPLLQMNRAGSVHLRQHHWMNWADVLAQVDPHFVVRAAESGLDLDPPHVAATSPRSLTYRVIARVLATLVDDRHAWDARMGHLDSSSDEDEDEERLDEINLRVPLAIEHIRRIAPTHDFGEPGRHLWTLRRGRDDDAYATDLVAVLCDDGHVFLPGAHAPTDLMALYNANRRRLGPTVHAALGSVLP